MEKIYKTGGTVTANFLNNALTGSVASYNPLLQLDIFPLVATNNVTYHVSACNVAYFEYSNNVPIGTWEVTPDCCCNLDIANDIEAYYDSKYDPENPDQNICIDVYLADNTATPINIDNIIAVSNGVLFGKVGNGKYVAIPLCSVFAYNFPKNCPGPGLVS